MPPVYHKVDKKNFFCANRWASWMLAMARLPASYPCPRQEEGSQLPVIYPWEYHFRVSQGPQWEQNWGTFQWEATRAEESLARIRAASKIDVDR